MSQSDTALELHSESEQENGGQVVPVQEAIRYRKRAQAAEQQVEMLTSQLAEQKQEQEQIQRKLSQSELNQMLIQAFTKANAVDLEAALLLARDKIGTVKDADFDVAETISAMRQERPWLFDGPAESGPSTARPTAGLRPGDKSAHSALTRCASQAKQSGSRRDMLEYLRMRRAK